jgi:hypothetical protein
MTIPSDANLQTARRSGLAVSGSHTIGAPDGGAGLPITGWSREHGDLRVPHFIGIHAVQLLPAIAWSIGLLGGGAWRRLAVVVAAAGYYALFAILLVQALAGHSVVPMMVSR